MKLADVRFNRAGELVLTLDGSSHYLSIVEASVLLVQLQGALSQVQTLVGNAVPPEPAPELQEKADGDQT